MIQFAHFNFNVLDLEKSLAFYAEALGLKKVREIKSEDFTIVYLEDEFGGFQLELTALANRNEPYDLGECEFHLAFITDEFERFYALHQKMDCICFENPAMGIYFIEDPDGYWLEVVPSKK